MTLIARSSRSHFAQLLELFVLLSLLGFSSSDNCTYSSTHFIYNVAEDERPGYIIANVTAASLTLANTDDNVLNISSLNGTSGSQEEWSIVLAGQLDADKPNELPSKIINVKCQNVGDPAEITIPITLMITDVNEFAPQFNETNFTRNISESTKIGSTIFTAAAWDPDKPQMSALLSYNITDGSKGYFAIQNTQNKGNVRLVKSLDYETGPAQFILNISVREDFPDGKIGKINYTVFTINILDEDDLMPEFLNTTYKLSISEGNYTGNWFVTTPALSARDGDLYINQTIQFKIGQSTQAMYNNLFSVAQNGSIGVNGHLSIGTYDVLIVAYQADNPSLRYNITIVTITVTDVNDHLPELVQAPYLVSVSEAASPGTIILIVTAKDNDSGNNSVIKFCLGNNASEIINVETNQNVGVIKLNKSLDRENMTNYVFQIWVEETMTQKRFNSSASVINITVLDDNDNTPNFDKSKYTFNLTRTHLKGDPVGQIFAHDPDDGANGQVTYNIQASAQSSGFAIDSKTGKITLNKNFSVSETENYDFFVIATDNAIDASQRRTSFTQVNVNILPVNTNPPYFVNEPYKFDVLETTKAGVVIGQVTALDSDGDVISYAMPKNDYLSLNPTTGQITLAKIADLDSNSSVPAEPLNFNVSASDSVYTNTTDVMVTFKYVNEFPPKFLPRGPVTVLENSTQDTDIVKVTAYDEDKGPDGKVTYSLVATTNNTLFKIDPKSGEIKLNCSSCLDYRRRSSYDIFVQATDGGSPPRQDTMTFLLNIEKTIFAPLIFSQKVYHVLIPENLPSPTILQLSVTNTDAPESNLKYNITYMDPPKAESYLQVFPNGTVYINSSINAEELFYFLAYVSVTDGHRSANAEIEVNITDQNDNSPNLNITQGPVLVPENSPVGKIVATVSAEDRDVTNRGFTFFLTEGTDGKFNINVTTGEITLTEQLDRRLKKVYNITVNVLDHGVPPIFVSGNMIIEVTDSNTAPHFVDVSNKNVSSYNFTVREDLNIGELVGSLLAVDPDFGSSGHLFYKIQSEDQSHNFLIEEDTGNLTLARSLNYEKQKIYSLTAVVRDNSYEPKNATATVTINVENVEEPPHWPERLTTVFITQSSNCKNEQQPLQAFSEEVATVFSKGDDSVEYYQLNLLDYFTINETSGLLKIVKTLSEGSYNLSLTACNKGSNVCSNASLPIVVKNGDIFAFCPAYYTIDVNETAGVNVSFLDLNTTKPDSEVHYNISSGNTEGKFGITESTGTLYVANKLDRETTSSYTLHIIAEDLVKQEVAEAQVHIRILDAQDEPPVFQPQSYQGEVLESQQKRSPVYIPLTNIGLVLTATDKDEQTKLSYSIDPASDTSNGSFSIDDMGIITLAKLVNYEAIPQSFNKAYVFQVLAKDGIYTGTATVTVHVQDDNDNEPTFYDQGDLYLNVSEGMTSIKEIATIKVNDPDINTKFQYFLKVIKPTTATDYFEIDESSGKLRVLKELDRELEAEYILNVTVTDGMFNISKLVIVQVSDINDNSPIFNQTFNMTVVEGVAGLGTNISVNAYDADTGQNAKLDYFIVAGNVNDSFRFDQNVLKTIRTLDREAIFQNDIDEIILTVTAVDHGNTSKTGTGTVIVTVADVNDNPPEFSQKVYHASLQENVTSSNVTLTPPIIVTDADSDSCKGFHFSLSDNSTFDVQESTGNLFVKGKLDREIKDVYNLSITVVDACGQFSSSAQIIISITDINDEHPQFLQPVYRFSISKNTSLYQVVGTVQAYDNDTNRNHVLYDLIYDMRNSRLFFIDHLKGNIQLNGDLDEEKGNIALNVSACDEDSFCGYATVYIDVFDTSNRCLIWNMTSLNLTINETNNAGLSVGYISAHDASSTGLIVSYYLNETVGSNSLHINNNTGELTLLKVFKADISDKNVLYFSVYAEVNSQPPCVQPGTLTITVKGINDNVPEICMQGQCGVSSIEERVYDQSPAGTLITLVTTRDNDTGTDGEVTLSLTVNETGLDDLFFLSDIGIISLKKDINLANIKNISQIENDTVTIILLAKDEGYEPLSSNVTIKVKIVNKPDGVPSFSNLSLNCAVQENEKAGTPVCKASATSNTSNNLIYSISTPFQPVPFSINQKTGIIKTTAELDREAVKSYPFIIQATNPSQGNDPVSVPVLVTVTDVNESPKFDKPNLTATVKEGAIYNDVVTLTAHDDDEGVNGSVTYNLHNADMYPNFTVNSSTGELSVISPLDYEYRSIYDLIIEAVDGGKPPLSTTVTIHVIVQDLNDNAPKFEQLIYECNITQTEPPIKVIKVTANDSDDGDNKHLIYSLRSHFRTFKIDPLTGEIETFAIPSSILYTLVIDANDMGNPPKIGTATVKVRVIQNGTDIVPSLFLSKNYVSLFVGMKAGTQLDVIIKPIHADQLKLSDVNGTDKFKLDKEKITLSQDLSQEAVYILSITATSITGYTVSEELEIHVISIKFSQQSYVVPLPENSDVPRFVLDIDTNAEQSGAPVFYSLVDTYSAFDINSSTGVLQVIQALDREKLPVYVLNVSLSLYHSGLPSHSRRKRAIDSNQDFASVYVTVEDINDNKPSFGISELILSVPFCLNASYLITTLKAIDPDEGFNGLVRYSILNEVSDAFELNPATGELRVVSPDKLNGKSFFTLIVQATDGNGTGNNSSNLNVTITVTQDGYQFRLPTPLSLSVLKKNEQAILNRLSQILGFTFSSDEITVHEDSGNVDPDRSDIIFLAHTQGDGNTTIYLSFNQIEEEVKKHQADIDKLFKSFITHPKSEEDSLNAASIALIALACIMFLVTLVAIIISCRLWKSQKEYAWKEENAVKVRNRMEEQSNIEEMKETQMTPDHSEHLEMTTISEVPISILTVVPEIPEQAINRQLEDVRQSLQPLGNDSADSGVASPLNSDSDGSAQESPVSQQKNVNNEERQEFSSSEESAANAGEESKGLQDNEIRSAESTPTLGDFQKSVKDESGFYEDQTPAISPVTQEDSSHSFSSQAPLSVLSPSSSSHINQNINSDLSEDQLEDAMDSTTNNFAVSPALCLLNEAFQSEPQGELSDTEAVTHF